MKNKFNNILVSESTKIKKILMMIDQNGKNGVFVIKSQKILGVITDADIRKSLLQGKLNKNSNAKSIMKKNFYSIPHTKKNLSKKILINSNKILIPILKKNKLIDYVHTSQFDSNKNKISKKILVIGGLGYIGSVLVELLLKNKYKVNILDINFYGCKLSKRVLNNKNLKVYYGDCNHKAKLRKAIKDCTDVIHLGEIVGDPAVNLNKNFSIRNNYESTAFVVSECIKNRINKFIFASSCSVYGESKIKCTENSKLNPVSLYAKCKIECEKTILSFKSENFCPVILRLSTVYGDSPRKRFDLVVNRFILMALKKININLYGGNSWRPFISVNDVTRSFLKILHSDEKIIKRQIFNLGGETQNFKIIDIIYQIKKSLKINFQKVKEVDDKRNYKVSFKKISKVLRFHPKDSLKKSITDLIHKYKKIKINERDVNYYNDKKIAKILTLEK